ncbi:MAG: NAD(P)-binding domain-containing protein, partial [Thermodesulfobacteriota bacterium]
MTIKDIAVIGLGAMGNPLATRLMKAGYSVTGYDIVQEKISNLISLGLKPAKSPKEAAAGAELILLSLRTWNIVREVMEGKDGVLASARKELALREQISKGGDHSVAAKLAVADAHVRLG